MIPNSSTQSMPVINESNFMNDVSLENVKVGGGTRNKIRHANTYNYSTSSMNEINDEN